MFFTVIICINLSIELSILFILWFIFVIVLSLVPFGWFTAMDVVSSGSQLEYDGRLSAESLATTVRILAGISFLWPDRVL